MEQMENFDVKVLCDYTAQDGMRKVSFATSSAVCSRQIDIAVDGDVIRAVLFTGGCNGNLRGITSLLAGMKVKDGQPVNTKQIWWAVKNFPDTLTYAEGRIFLMI